MLFSAWSPLFPGQDLSNFEMDADCRFIFSTETHNEEIGREATGVVICSAEARRASDHFSPSQVRSFIIPNASVRHPKEFFG